MDDFDAAAKRIGEAIIRSPLLRAPSGASYRRRRRSHAPVGGEGRPRIVLEAPAGGEPSIRVLDADGDTVLRLPE